MSTQPSKPTDHVPQLVMIAAGTLIACATIAAWLWGATHGVDTSPLFAFTIPLAGALLIGHQLSRTGDAAKQAAIQTNGNLEARMKAAAAAALADRDAARTRQQLGDVSEDAQAPRPPDRSLSVS